MPAYDAKTEVATKTGGGWCKVPNRLARLLATVSESELKVWLVFRCLADAAGIAFPSPQYMADPAGLNIGLNVRTIERAIASLHARGFLEHVDVGPGRGKLARRRATLPENPAPVPVF